MKPILLSYRPPLDWETLLGFFRRRAIAGLEDVDAAMYRRAVRVNDATGRISVRHDARGDALVVTIDPRLARHRDAISRSVRNMFDLDADPAAISNAFARDPLLAVLDRARPGIRVPGAWDPFEIAVRAVIGQQISVAAARSLLSRIVAERGEDLGNGERLFPTASQLAKAPLAGGMPRARIESLHALASAIADGRVDCENNASLQTVRGVGPWTAGYVAMRCGDRDAFPTGDLVLRRAAGGVTARELTARAEAWRPFRAYACMLLWRG